MFKSYLKEISELKDMEWVQKVYQENVGKLVGYFMQFIDGSFIVGTVKRSGFEYTFVQKKHYLSEEESNAELFVNFINFKFDGKLATGSFMKAIHKEFDPNRENPIEEMSVKEMEAEMLEAAKMENFDRASLIKKKLEKK